MEPNLGPGAQGGLLVPRESILYIGDTARSPYGPKPIADVTKPMSAVESFR